ncbi:MAG: putative molybdenum carrier protein [Thermodesulfobacteriota bacterium]
MAMIISGGQTGVDRAALDAALALGLPLGGWCPRGRRAEDGTIPPVYSLRETASSGYASRTLRNVREADATLILCRGRLSGGTGLTAALARKLGKPALVVDLAGKPSVRQVRSWARRHRVEVLNVAGPRESKCPGIQRQATRFLLQVLGDR